MQFKLLRIQAAPNPRIHGHFRTLAVTICTTNNQRARNAQNAYLAAFCTRLESEKEGEGIELDGTALSFP
nr:hypothetical protein [uncultured Desulfobulbus sp.]